MPRAADLKGRELPSSAKITAARIATQLTWQAALRAERLISTLRLVFCTALLARYLLLDVERLWQSLVCEAATLVTGMLYSVAMLRAIRAGRASSMALHGAVVLDAMICFGSLFQTTLWPGALPYRGILARPDPTAMLVVVCCAGYRLSVGLAVTSGVLNALAFAVLVGVERARYAATLAYGWADVFLFASVFGCAATLGVAIARRTARLVESGALASFTIDRTRDGLANVLLDQHDARNLLHGATLHANLIQRAIDSSSGAVEQIRTLSGRLVEDLALATRHLSTLGERTYGQFAGLHALSVVETGQTLPSLRAAVKLRFPALTLHMPSGELPCVLVVGGRASLERVLFNLVANAAQGDGRRGASNVWIAAQPEPARAQLRIEINDDGPGFDQATRPAAQATSLSTKRDGSGIGLLAISSIAEQSGGTVEVSNTARGARVTLHLPMLPSPVSVPSSTDWPSSL